ncbi:class I SAM-dependent DNA methyltransferase [Geodermatophilus sabuli]|uniref:dTDP-3-amino-3,6-dideoxy-alpha-D-glucopyranose N,N-dimethyltransferase n=1 Tax=Geodermatophilus sabuli TaxID=1564158 RepID=A0A285EIA4_9ACTN|nr:class I SAM-dependent methyltransferase [Geodermatophilus sabuli]MBB3086886.1 SAM-dependent methyltransferase [Geodermatophilus sabuli]SNX98740.1 dTDP-3-amino-3,6-dideoxy-alpha-D-glucopyranose N,N-dimethyltransferase [Geodermatophilus sabuli]
MYSQSARLYDVMYAGKDYAAAARYVRGAIEAVNPKAATLLDVACGTGQHLEHLRASYDVEGLDLNPDLLAAAHTRCPGVPLHHADMSSFSLPRRFDVITCLFGSVAYLKTADRLTATVKRMASHLTDDGVLLIEPWFTPTAFWSDHLVANFYDSPDLKLAWMYRHERDGDMAILDQHFLVGEPHGIESFTERHELGLFSEEDWDAAFAAGGLLADFDDGGPFGRGLYKALRLPGTRA